MARYAIGDIQGCYHSLMNLLEQLDFQPGQDTLWLVGDLINRGTGSLAVLRWVFAHQHCVRVVLGNHDLHTIAVAHHIKPPRRFDTLSELLSATDGHELLHWLRQQPLMVLEADFAMLHAGLYPQWTLAQARALAAEVEAVLQSPQYLGFLQQMYGNQPAAWQDNLTGIDRLRAITNAFTRMRLLDAEGTMEFAFKGELADVPAGCMPWFLSPERQSRHDPQTILFGHWSALGLYQGHGVMGLDTGCLWGRQLTAYALETGHISQVPLDPRDRPADLAGD
ncbi:MAG TPA: symmetrical bis(5'-nucleosyl)-tetraphosphatase [Methylophilus sp.]|nr:symmetrical bis(5'-nucleosyl)-tetraphosphatase [Methylophilus sp.]